MARITVEDCLKRVNNRFALVILGTKRAKQLLAGSTPRISEVKNKSIVTALREIADGFARFKTDQEMEADREKRERDRQEAMAAAAASLAAQQQAASQNSPALPGSGTSISLEPISTNGRAESNGSV